MTEGSLLRYVNPMCVRIWLEVGHSCEPRPRSSLGRALALDWKIWVRGVRDHDISTFVHKVVFYLHPSSAFVYPKRVIQEPPYEIQESGCASIDIPIHVYLKHSIKPKKIKLRYSLQIEDITANTRETSCVYYDFEDPPEQLKRSLMKSGGEIINRTSSPVNGPAKKTLVATDAERRKRQPVNKMKKFKFIEPIQCNRPPKKYTKPLQEICPKCGDPTNVDFRKLLKSVSMSDAEIDIVSQVYLSYSRYERSVDAIVLPPLSDPIYRLPELPPSLRNSLTSVEADYSMQ